MARFEIVSVSTGQILTTIVARDVLEAEEAASAELKMDARHFYAREAQRRKAPPSRAVRKSPP